MTSENGVNEIKSKILKTEPVYWEKLKYIQNDNFKELSKEAYKKLKQSMLNNDYVMPFAVWQDKDSIYVIDGVHRCRVLSELKKEGYLIPATFPANFLDCKNRKEAAKLVLVYSSAYAKTTLEGMDEFLSLEDLNFDDLKVEIDIPGIDDEYFNDPQETAVNDISDKIKTTFEIVVTAKNEAEQEEIYNHLNNEGYECRILTL